MEHHIDPENQMAPLRLRIHDGVCRRYRDQTTGDD
jgi:hypothetical protein